MKKICLMLLLLPVFLQAHPGHDGADGVDGYTIIHLFTTPSHLLSVGLAILALITLRFVFRKKFFPNQIRNT